MSTLYFFDLFGTFVFALSGALLGVRKRMDLYGLFVLALAVAVGGGTIRDTLLGSVPPAVLKDPLYFTVVVVAVLSVFFYSGRGYSAKKTADFLVLADAIGLGVFTFIGASKGLAAGLHWHGVLLAAVLTSTGGGMIRDLLAGEVPLVMRKEIYASASMGGAAVYLLLQNTTFQLSTVALLTSLVTISIRLYSLQRGVQLPVIDRQMNRLRIVKKR